MAKNFISRQVGRVKVFFGPLRNMLRVYFHYATRLVNKPKKPNNSGQLYVNLGCGTTNHPQFINVDGYPHRHVHYVHVIDKLPMFKNNSVDMIYASHCLEHFKYRDISLVLSEWVRVLKPGGLLRLSVPDFDRLLKIYNVTNNPDDVVEQIMGGQNNKYNFHYALFNENNLSSLLTGVGCNNVRKWIPGEDGLSMFDDFSIYTKPIHGEPYEVSLNIEARKR